MVEIGVSQEELQQILSQLRAMSRDTAVVPPPQPAAPPPPVYNVPPVHYSQSSTSPAPGGIYSGGVSVNSQASTSAAPIPSAVPSISGITSLFDSLVKAGVVSANNTPRGAGMSTQTPPPVSETPDETKTNNEKKAKDERLEMQRAYARRVLGMSVRLTTADITK